MKKLEFEIAGIPALLVGEPSERLYLYVHGKMGCKEEALDFAERGCSLRRGYPCCGSRSTR